MAKFTSLEYNFSLELEFDSCIKHYLSLRYFCLTRVSGLKVLQCWLQWENTVGVSWYW